MPSVHHSLYCERYEVVVALSAPLLRDRVDNLKKNNRFYYFRCSLPLWYTIPNLLKQRCLYRCCQVNLPFDHGHRIIGISSTRFPSLLHNPRGSNMELISALDKSSKKLCLNLKLTVFKLLKFPIILILTDVASRMKS